jgi:hypothetical protein
MVQPVVQAFIQVFRHLWIILLINGVTAALCIPFALALAFLPLFPHSVGPSFLIVSILVAVLPTPGAAGLHVIAHELAEKEHPFLSDVWEGFRACGLLAVKVWLISAFCSAIIIANLEYYARAHFVFAPFLVIIWLYILFVWLGIQLYVYPVIVEQEVKRVLPVFRNAFVIAVTNRLYTAGVTVIWACFVVVSSLSVASIFLGLALSAAIQHNATRLVTPTALPGATPP